MIKAKDAYLINEWLVGKTQMRGKDLKRVFKALVKDIKPSDLEAKRLVCSKNYSGTDDIKNALLTLATRYNKQGMCFNVVRVDGVKGSQPLYAEFQPAYKLNTDIYEKPYDPESFKSLAHRWFRVRSSGATFKVVEYDTVGVVTGSGVAYSWREFMEKCELVDEDTWWAIIKNRVGDVLKLIGA